MERLRPSVCLRAGVQACGCGMMASVCQPTYNHVIVASGIRYYVRLEWERQVSGRKAEAASCLGAYHAGSFRFCVGGKECNESAHLVVAAQS